jgi:hypothetical protein
VSSRPSWYVLSSFPLSRGFRNFGTKGGCVVGCKRRPPINTFDATKSADTCVCTLNMMLALLVSLLLVVQILGAHSRTVNAAPAISMKRIVPAGETEEKVLMYAEQVRLCATI